MLLGLLFGTSCKKFIAVEGAGDQLEQSQVFSNDATANNAVAGMYRYMRDFVYGSNSFAAYLALSSDDSYSYFSVPVWDEYANNTLQSNNGALPWQAPYNIIYQANGIVEGLKDNNKLSPAARDQYEGEAKLMRSYCYLFLVNLFGDVPLLTTTAVSINASAARTESAKVYALILSDLKDAQSLLKKDYAFSEGKKIRANYWVATALLARVYLYMGDWANSKVAAQEVIGSGQFSLLSELNDYAIENNQEALLQLANQVTERIWEPFVFAYGDIPVMPFRPGFIDSFEPNDQRRTKWVRMVTYEGGQYYLPYKYKLTVPGPERYTLLRLAEQYLIRAEANAHLGELTEAVDDLNVIRNRAGLPSLAVTISQDECLAAVAQERRMELFTEAGHRWFDLKRTGKLDGIMQLEKPSTWKSYAALFPIPISELQTNPALQQNPGY
ncbi:hypothetical protein OI18_22025 [Flavihumibacter solisilvae]|uniref:Glycan metabolism protein RagB n=2 Tax=Flavihumibacter solisilvae TaxID=1349421 RepID=A0A0C1L8Y0_9BACT|nr:hypothetical protein OI18_22025 [Flavihumibacter solisilvae]